MRKRAKTARCQIKKSAFCLDFKGLILSVLTYLTLKMAKNAQKILYINLFYAVNLYKLTKFLSKRTSLLKVIEKTRKSIITLYINYKCIPLKGGNRVSTKFKRVWNAVTTALVVLGSLTAGQIH